MDTEEEYSSIVFNHYENNWEAGYQIKRYDKGSMNTLSPDYCILEYPPNSKRKMWTYATCGMSSLNDEVPIELHIFCSFQDAGIVELLTAVSYYHMKNAKLNLNHTVNFGIPWQSDSKCSYGLISLPYLDGSNLEICEIPGIGSIHFYWLLPITLKELNYKKKFGVDALEKQFEVCKFNYLDPHRKSVV